MKSLLGASLTFAVAALLNLPAAAADLPQVKISDGNAVPACATPGRLMAYLHARNPNVDGRFEGVATEYMRHGEALGLRWDVAFFQMILETGALGFTGDVRADQNNFAGLGASGGGAHGERFANISSGVKAHLQHLLMYSGEHIDNPVAERTRKVQEWGVLTDWQKTIKGPMTYTLVARQWAPTSRNYVRDITQITEGFYSEFCNGPDPQPQMVQEARAGHTGKQRTQVAANTDVPEAAAATPNAAAGVPDPATQTPDADKMPVKVSGTEIAKRSIEEERKEGAPRTALGAGMLGNVAEAAKAAADQQQAQKTVEEPPVTLLNAQPAPEAESTPDATAAAAPEAKPEAKAAAKPAAKADAKATATAEAKPSTKADAKAAAKVEAKADAKAAAKPATKATAKAEPSVDSAKGAAVQTASIAGAATQLKLPAKNASKCKVWTASYGGQRAVIIKASASGSTNYTVLDVTEANEKREIDAYIAAYAKGGEKLGSFASQTKALNKAFELCPEG